MPGDPSPSAAPLVRGHIRELDGLRGIAILLVMLHHFWPTRGILAPWKPLAHLGWIGVDLFFVISGFLITGILLDTRESPRYFRNFYARRALRIFPLYYLFLALAFLLIPLAQGGPWWESEFVSTSGSPLWYVLYGSNVREAITGHEPAYVLAPLWSLSIEEQFYLSFPLVVVLVSPRSLRRLLLALVLLAPLWRTVTMLLWPANERIQYLATFSRMDVLALGGILALLFRSKEMLLLRPATTRRLLLLALAGCGIAFALTGLDRTQPFCRTAGYSLVGLLFALLICWTAQNRGLPATGWLRFGPLCSLGTICYGTYLLQRPAEVIVGKLASRVGLASDLDSLPGLFVKCVAAVGIAFLSWNCFEKPLLSLKRRFRTDHHPASRRQLEGPAKDSAPSPALQAFGNQGQNASLPIP
jgi:peptidoglycan/LPS O-acetylase OafA/YrhL